MFGRKRDIYGYPVQSNRKRLVLIVLGLVCATVVIAVVAGALSKSKNASEQKTLTTNTFSNSQFSASYPDGFEVTRGTVTSPYATFSPADKENDSNAIEITRYGRQEDMELEKLRQLISAGAEDPKISEKEIDGNKILVLTTESQDAEGKTSVRHDYYVRAAIYVWKLTITTPKGSSLDSHAEQILASFKPKDADILRSLTGDGS
ncbi:hypothetical protein E6Q11_04195 [Candidatus Dojkabacteria bacterium]|uniref:Uncharacterized protein n=1 Tax=Candidatus Dojkabacteria bacterium TaxID=2099670 RepID=A0A5C7J7Z9_9BACT|nr:MAG: hypothetical protein E6Q11_04195 [Candidatus Dojkabacteria bacterium]